MLQLVPVLKIAARGAGGGAKLTKKKYLARRFLDHVVAASCSETAQSEPSEPD
tara:strand:- start:1465 stop:1623 length:159 start_codon:yes stop_codon:yes gene_type:complete